MQTEPQPYDHADRTGVIILCNYNLLHPLLRFSLEQLNDEFAAIENATCQQTHSFDTQAHSVRDKVKWHHRQPGMATHIAPTVEVH